MPRMQDDSGSRIERLSTRQTEPLDMAAASAAIERYLAALGVTPRPIEWGIDAVDALARVATRVLPFAASAEALRSPRVREAHVEAQRRSFPDGDLTRLAAARWREASAAARAVAHNLAWDRATARWVDTLGPQRFTHAEIGALGTRVPSHAIDAQLFAVGWAVWPDLAAGRDPSWAHLAGPLAETYLAGAQRLWVLADAILVAPRFAVP